VAETATVMESRSQHNSSQRHVATTPRDQQRSSASGYEQQPQAFRPQHKATDNVYPVTDSTSSHQTRGDNHSGENHSAPSSHDKSSAPASGNKTPQASEERTASASLSHSQNAGQQDATKQGATTNSAVNLSQHQHDSTSQTAQSDSGGSGNDENRFNTNKSNS
jgi:hypothetical protein